MIGRIRKYTPSEMQEEGGEKRKKEMRVSARMRMLLTAQVESEMLKREKKKEASKDTSPEDDR